MPTTHLPPEVEDLLQALQEHIRLMHEAADVAPSPCQRRSIMAFMKTWFSMDEPDGLFQGIANVLNQERIET